MSEQVFKKWMWFRSSIKTVAMLDVICSSHHIKRSDLINSIVEVTTHDEGELLLEAVRRVSPRLQNVERKQ